MPSLADAIHAFQSGGLSRNEFLARAERALALEARDGGTLFEVLRRADGEHRLPPDLYAELEQRIVRGAGNEATRLQTAFAGQVGNDRDRDRAAPAPEADGIKGAGDTLNGRFVLEECIGFGGMGTVYKALDLRKLEASDRKPYIAIKVLNVQFRGHPKSLITLQREAKKAQALAHPNIVTVYDFDRDGATVYLTMEYLSGKPLSHMLRAPGFCGLPYAEVLRIVGGIAKGLAYAHQRGFVHCDLKPANVFLTDRNEVKVIDFGIARAFHKPEDDGEATVFDAGSLGGLTPAYASPEMLEHLEPDPRDDIYALACITYELLSGRHPFDRLSASQARHAGMKPQRPHLGLRPWHALKAALAFERERRTPTVEAFIAAFSGARRPVEYLALAGGAVLALALALAAMLYAWRAPAKVESGKIGAVSVPANVPERPPPPSSGTATAPAPATTTTAPSAPALSLAAVAPALAEAPCSALAPSVRGGALQVRGFVAQRYGASSLKDRLEAIPGVQALDLKVESVADDKCGVIAALGPYWVRSRQAGSAAGVHLRSANNALSEGDALVLEITTPAWDSYVYIDYYMLDGSVLHLVPSPRAQQNQAPAGYAATIGNSGNWVITKPFGTEMIALVTAPAPLFPGMRAEHEPGAAYLQALQKQLAQAAATHGQERVSVDLIQLTTRARKR
jgi:serine/threonine protein kinase